jgi:hypothetical protein
VTVKLIEAKRDLTPAKCKPRITISTLTPLEPSLLRGGYIVQPVPAPLSTTVEAMTMTKATGNNQNLIALTRGSLISGAHKKSGSNQLPKPPIIAGITIKKIIIKA